MAATQGKYIQWLYEIKNTLQKHQLRNALHAYSYKLIVYWYVGYNINNKIEQEN